MLDSSALLGLLNGEPGAERVAEALPAAVIGAVNLAEVVTKLRDRGLSAEEVDEVLGGLHLDVRPRERDQVDEVAWLLDHGATEVADRRGKYGPGTGWVTLADPEGNQFCVLSSRAELAARS